jgi:hypothetical protein
MLASLFRVPLDRPDMEKPMMEYAFLVQACELGIDGKACQVDRGQAIAERLAALGEPLRLSLNSFDQGGWQVLSHDVMETNGSLVVSFLIFRQQRPNLREADASYRHNSFEE